MKPFHVFCLKASGRRGSVSVILGFLFILCGRVDAVPKVITWATNPDYPPYDWADENERYAGAAVLLLDLICPSDIEFQQVSVPWIRAQAMAKDGKIDMLVNIRITPERSEWLEFSKNPTFPNPIAIFMLEDKTIPFKSWDELLSLRGGIASGDFFGNGFDEYLRDNLQWVEVPSAENAFQMLCANRIDYFVSGKYMGLAWLERNPQKQKIVPLDPLVSDNWIHLGFSKKSSHLDLLPSIDRCLEKLGHSGMLEVLLDKALIEYGKTSP